MYASDISDNELAKSHARYMIGGSQEVPNERVFRFGRSCYSTSLRYQLGYTEFPERPNALRNFLLGVQHDWNISMFHYRNHGAGMCIDLVPLII